MDLKDDSHQLVEEEKIFNSKLFKDKYPNLTDFSNDFSESFLVHCEFGDYSTIDPLRYKPEIGDLNTFELPELLPSISGMFL